MAGEGAAAGGAGGHRGLRLLADKRLVDRDITRFGQRLDMGAEITVGGAVSFFSRANSSPTPGGSAFSAAMMRSRSG